MQSEVIARLKSAIADAESDMENDYAAAETTGERVDLYDYGVSISLEDARALEAALSAAEPARWLVEEHLPSGSIRWQAVEHEHHAREIASKSKRTTVCPLYRVPPAPSVAVKALEWRDEPIPPSGETLASSVVGLYCIPHSGDRFYLRFCDAMTLGNYSTLDKAKAAAQADYEARIRSALSAQVQDVAGWQLVPIEPTDEMHSAARDWAVKKYGLGIGRDGSDGCYRAMLAAAPAKQEGGHD